METVDVDTARRIFDEVQTEWSWQLTVFEVAARTGWEWHYTPDWQWKAAQDYAKDHPSVYRKFHWAKKGWPDLVMWNEALERTIYVELKAEGNTLSDDQVERMTSLHRAGNECYAWKPRDRDQVDRVLAGGPREDDGTGFLKPWPRKPRQRRTTS